MAYFPDHSQSNFIAIQSNDHPIQVPSKLRAAPTKAAAQQFSASNRSFETVSDNVASALVSLPTNRASNSLRSTWTFWYRHQQSGTHKNAVSYEEGIKKIGSFDSVESFWTLYTHLNPPSQIQPTTDYLLFHVGVLRPVWEDPLNISGGKVILRIRKGLADRLWEDLLCAIIGDQFGECRDLSIDDELPPICGCTLSVRLNEDIIAIWYRVEGDVKWRDKIRDTVRRVLNLPPQTIFEYKTNNDSMHDNSSFRNSAVDRAVVH